MARFRLVPLLFPAVSLALGIYTGSWLALIDLWAGLLFCSLVAAILAWWFCRKRRWLVSVLILAVFFSLGGLRLVQANWYYPADHIIRYCQADSENVITVSGVVITDSRPLPKRGALASYNFMQSDGVAFDLAVDQVETHAGPQVVSGLVRVNTRFLTKLHTGTRLKVTGAIYSRSKADNQPGSMPRRTGILTGMTIEQPGLLATIDTAPSNFWLQIPDILRQKLLQVFIADDGTSDFDSDPVLAALLLGTYQGITPAVREDFLRSGTMHYLSLSGMHIATLTGFVWLFLKLFSLPRWLQGLIPALFVTGYMLIVPAQPPILRAGVVTLFFCLGYMSRRSSSSVNLLSLSALILLLIRPLDLFDIGFQLSFAIVLAILIFSPELLLAVATDPTHIRLRDPKNMTLLDTRPAYKRYFGWFRQWLFYGFSISLVATLVSVPIIAENFNRISWLAVINSMLLALPVTLAMLAGICKLALATLAITSPALDSFFSGPANMLLWLTHLEAEFPGTSENIRCLPFWLNLIYAGLIIITLTLAFIRNRYWLKWSACGLLLCLIVVVLHIAFCQSVAKMTIHALQVGHGNCIVIELPGSNPILCDCGSNDDFNLAEYKVIPYLRKLGTNSLAAVVVSHADIDHYNGVPDLLAAIPSPTMILPVGFELDFTASDHDFMAFPQVAVTDKLYLRQGDSIKVGAGLIEILWPDAGQYAGTNDRCLVLRISQAGRSIMLCGDITPTVMEKILASGQNLHADYVVLPHHGEYSNELVKFINAVNPTTAIVSSRNLTEPKNSLLQALPGNLIMLSKQGNTTLQ